MTGLATEANTFIGNALQGIYITWSHTADDAAGTIGAATEMKAEIKLNLFGVATALDTSVIANDADVTFYLLF